MRLKLLYTNRYILNFKTRKKLAETLVLSLINYSIAVYFPCLDYVTRYRVQKIQNSCCRFVCGLRKFSHVSKKINELRWLRVDQLFTYNLLILLQRKKSIGHLLIY
ncbi:unnamed protein product [Acanthoscelides obtectus]|uniref:Uncharacterized protein n=1 Tax=Acanthoscelides obtectus TaxID=200917 RepID=A0A9P0L195_ACAOB|nr:unnamed protein product [Acanthoscelides obtectus]CAK1680961.1 hypothetical protein AOBTE_LOCUS32960 [Acanthoscelides obtectus]